MKCTADPSIIAIFMCSESTVHTGQCSSATEAAELYQYTCLLANLKHDRTCLKCTDLIYVLYKNSFKDHNPLTKFRVQNIEHLGSCITYSSSCRRASKSSLLVCFSAPGVLRTLLCSAIFIVVLFNSSCMKQHKNVQTKDQRKLKRNRQVKTLLELQNIYTRIRHLKKRSVVITNYIGFELVDDLQSEGINWAVIHQRLQHIFRSDYWGRSHTSLSALKRSQNKDAEEFRSS